MGDDEQCTSTLSLGQRVYRLSVEDGKVVIHQLTAKEAAIEEIESQPFFGGKHG